MGMAMAMAKAEEVAALVALLIGVLTTINAETDSTDASTLNNMYSSLNSPQKLTKWRASGGDPCGESWKGIKCSGSRVTGIQISGLGLSGNMGYMLDKLTSVTTFDISGNNLATRIPYQLPPKVRTLNLAANGFSDNLPYSISQMASLKYLNVSHNKLQGQVAVPFTSLTALTTLDFSFNKMTGNLPESFESLKKITNMYLQNNQFTGTIDVLGNLPLKNLNIKNNKFSGSIPKKLKRINIKVKGNSFKSARAPPPSRDTPLAKRPKQKPVSGVSSEALKSEDNNGGDAGQTSISAGVVAGMIISILVVGAVVACLLIKRRSKKSAADIEKLESALTPRKHEGAKDVKSVGAISTASRTTFQTADAVDPTSPHDHLKSFDENDPLSAKLIVPPTQPNEAAVNVQAYSIVDLQLATDSFSRDKLIGEGSIGCVYKAQLDDGKIAVVKKINSSLLPDDKSFLDVVSVVSKLDHPNITEFLGYCCEHGQHLLVYEYHDNGSLHEFLHQPEEHSAPLTWNNRVNIALGVALGLEYLHEVCSSSVVHLNFKSANILLDQALNPHLSDCGLASLIQVPDQVSGYNAPEVSMSSQHTTKSDVYSLGVVMLELLTGRKPFDRSRPRPEQFLVQWATPRFHDIDTLSMMVDPALEGQYSIKSLSRFADVVALCVQTGPEFRPPISEVVEVLVRMIERSNLSLKRT